LNYSGDKKMIRNDLTKGNIFDKLVKLALPIMGTSFLQMAYNMIDMIWIGRLGAASVAAVGTAGFFMWLSMSFIALTRVGAEVNIAQALGAKDIKKANINVSTSMLFTLILALLYVIFIILFKDKLIGFFNLNDVTVEGYAKEYLFIIAFGMIFSFFNQVISGAQQYSI